MGVWNFLVGARPVDCSGATYESKSSRSTAGRDRKSFTCGWDSSSRCTRRAARRQRAGFVQEFRPLLAGVPLQRSRKRSIRPALDCSRRRSDPEGSYPQCDETPRNPSLPRKKWVSDTPIPMNVMLPGNAG